MADMLCICGHSFMVHDRDTARCFYAGYGKCSCQKFQKQEDAIDRVRQLTKNWPHRRVPADGELAATLVAAVEEVNDLVKELRERGCQVTVSVGKGGVISVKVAVTKVLAES